MATEAFRKDVSRQLTELQDADGPASVEFPSTLNSEERKYIHHLAHQFGLSSKSKGGGANRYLTVAKKSGGVAKATGKGHSLGSSALAVQSNGSPMRLPQHLLQDPQLKTLPECPEKWAFSSPADLRRLKGSGKGASCRLVAEAEDISREALDMAEASRADEKPAYADFQAARHKLPAWAHVDEILQALESSRVVLVAGETGCGKSTQVPQYVLDAVPSSQLVVTQPRRIAAVSLAQRVAQERVENVGHTVGYSIHMESKTSKATRCTFCTTGVFRRRLLSDPRLSGLTHVMVDEVHERELHSDFVLIVLKQLLAERQDLRLILMSATLQLEVFQKYFPGCTTVQIPGRTFPVHRFFLEDVAGILHKTLRFRPFLGPAFAAAGHVPDEKDFKRQVSTNEGHYDQVCGYGQYLSEPLTTARLADGCFKHDVLQQGRGTAFDIPIIDALILHLDEEFLQKQKKHPQLKPGAILIFFPGWGDIDHAKRRLRGSLDTKRFLVLPCHSQVRAEQQREIFKVPPPGVRKIILASNIAETSITIEDVSVVIDTGRAKETSYDPYLKVGTLATTFISKASTAQRAGRAGRTKEGICYHLFSKKRLEKLEEFRAPELLRSPLEDVCLHTAHLLAQQCAATGNGKAVGGRHGPAGIATWLAQAPQPPEAVAVRNAVELLKVLGALTPCGALSGLGAQLANLPLPATIARSVVWGALLGCLDPILLVISASTGRDVFQLPQDPGGKGNGKMGNRGSSFGYLSGLLQKLKRELTAPVESDHIALLRAVNLFEEEKRRGGESAARRVCERYSLNRNSVQSVIDVRDRMKRELKHQRLLTDDLTDFANRNADDHSVLIAVVAAGVFPNLAVKRPHKKKIEVNGGRVDAGTHPSSIVVSKDKGGKGTGKSPAGPAEWLCYTEMTQVEERYSMTGVSWVSPVTLLLLCGNDPIEVQGTGADVSASLLDGWAEFVMPKAQVILLQKLRYKLRQAFAAYCSSPERGERDFSSVLDVAVTILQGSVDEAGRPVNQQGYNPKVSAYVAKAGTSSAAADYNSLITAAANPARERNAAIVAKPAPPRKAEDTGLKEGLEIQGLTGLLHELYGAPPQGQRAIEWQFASSTGGTEATLTITQDGSTFSGPLSQNRKLAQRLAARAAWEALKASNTEAQGEEEEVVEEVQEENDEEVQDLEEMCIDAEASNEDAGVESLQIGEEDAAEEEEVAEEAQEDYDEGVQDGIELDSGELDVTDDLDLLSDVDPSMAAALRFMQGDAEYKDSAASLAEELSPPCKKQRLR